ncbi:tRNA (adenosine(37)-N6)-threonylcarbamoyltransferase complex ATPase subunit type 1 TsaE [bacterium]|jgi:tRNA threonylcarbamoyladenosine biosynthesis protein TsaE|nr:tRNA (adenosine(37)-N6)-threonylcarbamoyltransferase complex ATPase subunit type 1 TsaE [bacterium]
MQEFITNNIKETNKVANDLATNLESGQLITLSGNLGAGKTVFVKALAAGLGISETITSPTFVLMKSYKVEYKKIKQLIHVDCYRLDGIEDVSDIGLQDFLNDPQTLVVIEWADKLDNLPKKNRIDVKIESLGQDKRKVVIT